MTKVEVLCLATCPAEECEATVAQVKAAVAEVGLEAEIEVVLVSSLEDARRRQLVRSPTIWIDGEELFLGGLTTAGLVACDCGSYSLDAMKKTLLRWKVLRVVGGWKRH
ncbi:MAG: thioredoxin family protein [Nitrospirae bacterium]|nr:thioredoxin family protein [Nitrospirota bacterium]